MAVTEVLETGWLSSTPVEDNLLRQFLYSQAAVNETIAMAAGGRTASDDDVFLADADSPVAYLNQAILTRPLAGPDDSVLERVDRFFASTARPVSLLSAWPTPEPDRRGWALVGHPMLVVRAPGPVPSADRAGVAVETVRTEEQLATAERIVIEGYPFDEAAGLPSGALFPPAVVETDLIVRLGLLDGEPVAVGNVMVAHGLVNLCLGATLPAARRRGVWENLVWARVAEDASLPAVAYTSDFSRPGFLRMGFLPVTRFTLWTRGGRGRQ